MLETPFAIDSWARARLGRKNAPLGQVKTWRRVTGEGIRLRPAPSLCWAEGAFFLPRRAVAHESVAKGVSSIRGF